MSSVYVALAKRKIFDYSFHPLVRWAVVYALYLRYHLAGGDGVPGAFKYLLSAHRYAGGRERFDFLNRLILRNLPRWLTRVSDQTIDPIAQPSKGFLTRTLVLKPPSRNYAGVNEKGVLLVAGHHGELYKLVDVSRLTKDYFLVFEPGWSGYASEDLLYYCKFSDAPIIVMSPEETDFVFLKNLRTNLVPVRFGASDWVDHRIFRPLHGTNKDYDAVMVAVWGRYKRHHALFRALRSIKRSGISVALVGIPWQGTREEIEALIDYYGVRSYITIYENLKPVEVNEVLNRSKVNMILTLREGANRSIFEGFFADTPGIVLRQNIGINKEYINEHTGKLIEEHELPQVLLWFRDNWQQFTPREWAMSNISPEVTAAKLNHVLREIALSRGEPWTRDIVVKCNSPEPTYYPDPSVARGFPTAMEIVERYRRG